MKINLKMKNTVPPVLILMLLISCSSETKPVAHYRYGTITGGDVARRAQGVKLTPQMNRSIIESLCVEGIARHYAVETGYDKNRLYLFKLERETQPFIKRFVNEKNGKSSGLSWEYVRCRHAAFNGGSSSEAAEEALKKAGRMIELLGKGVNFDSLVKSSYSDPEKALEMSTVFAVRGGGRPEFEDAAFALPEGSYSTEPVVLKDGTAIVFISDERGTFTPDNMEKKITTPGERKRISELVERDRYSKIISRMEKENSASFKVTALPGSGNAVLFSIAGRNYTYVEMLERRNLLSAIIMEPLEDKGYLFGLAKEWYYDELYRTAAERIGYLDDKKLAVQLKSGSDFILANDYIRNQCEKGIVIAERDIREEFDRYREQYKIKTEVKNRKTVQLSYNSAKVFIKKKLISERVAAAVSLWKMMALAESGLIFED